MARTDRLKREMLRAAVRENVEILSGELPASLRPRRRFLRTWAWRMALVVVPTALFLSGNAIVPAGAQKSDVVVVRPLPAGPPAAAVPATAVTLPRRLDPSLFRLAVTHVVIDPGHGGADPGALTPFGLKEKEITLDVALRLQALLADARFRVELTRAEDAAVSLKDRAQFANERHADLFVSIHVNSIPRKDRRLVETFFCGPTDDPHVDRLAGEENRGSGYSLSDYRQLLEGLYADMRQTESRAFALAVQDQLVAGLRRVSPGLENRGVKSAPFVVLIATEMPGVLAEVSCISNETDAKNLAHPDYRQAIAQALADGVRAYAEVRGSASPKGS